MNNDTVPKQARGIVLNDFDLTEEQKEKMADALVDVCNQVPFLTTDCIMSWSASAMKQSNGTAIVTVTLVMSSTDEDFVPVPIEVVEPDEAFAGHVGIPDGVSTDDEDGE
jgi:hypothetical protein